MSLALQARPGTPPETLPAGYRRLDAPLGGEVVGLDLAAPLDDAGFAALRRAFLDSEGVLVIRGQDLTPAQQIAFSRRFGPLQIHVLAQFLLPRHPEILVVSNVIEDGKPIGLGDAGRYWHSDLSYRAVPSLGSLLYARELPAEGGDTLFANMYRAYEELPDEVKRAIAGRRAVHAYGQAYGRLAGSTWRQPLDARQQAQVQPVEHPVVRRHPETGRPALFVNEGFTTRILGLSEDESAALLALLFKHATQDRFVYRHAWSAGDMVFWDNRCAVHLAAGCPAHLRRTLHRTTVEGDVPVGI